MKVDEGTLLNEFTEIMRTLEAGDTMAADRLLLLVYEELRKLAAAKLSHEPAGQTLQATALVHEAYLRLVGDATPARWNSRGHFFAAAAEAMRRILVEQARRRKSSKRGGDRHREPLDEIAAPEPDDQLLAIDCAFGALVEADPQAAELVKLRYFAGLTMPQAALTLNISERTAGRVWAYARAWLRREVEKIG